MSYSNVQNFSLERMIQSKLFGESSEFKDPKMLESLAELTNEEVDTLVKDAVAEAYNDPQTNPDPTGGELPPDGADPNGEGAPVEDEETVSLQLPRDMAETLFEFLAEALGHEIQDPDGTEGADAGGGLSAGEEIPDAAIPTESFMATLAKLRKDKK